MPEIGTATVKVVPDMTAMEGITELPQDGARLLFNVLTILLIVCSPALVWAVYGWAF